MTRALPLVVLALGCASTPRPTPAIPLTRAPEVRELPSDPAEEALPPGTPPGESIEPLEAGSCYDATGVRGGNQPCPSRSGLLVSEARAVRDGLYRIRYRELRVLYGGDRTTWSAQRELYEAMIARDRAEIERLRPTWLQQNGLALGLASGLVLGIGASVAIAALAQ